MKSQSVGQEKTNSVVSHQLKNLKDNLDTQTQQHKELLEKVAKMREFQFKGD